MPPPALFPFLDEDLDTVRYDRAAIAALLPQRGHFAQLDDVVLCRPEAGEAVARRELRPDEFWVEGHLPGRPLLPGVLMIEAAGQLASLLYLVSVGTPGFIGFAGVDEVRFRRPVTVGDRLWILARVRDLRPRRIVYDTQIFLAPEARLVFEGRITGMVM